MSAPQVKPRRAGWIGSREQLFEALEAHGAEKDANGRFNIWASELPEDPPLVSFLGLGQEWVVSPRALCKINGDYVPVVNILPGDLGVTVIP